MCLITLIQAHYDNKHAHGIAGLVDNEQTQSTVLFISKLNSESCIQIYKTGTKCAGSCKNNYWAKTR